MESEQELFVWETYCKALHIKLPKKAFPHGKYSRPICLKQMNADEENKVPEGEIRVNRYAHDASAEFVSTPKLTARLKL